MSELEYTLHLFMEGKTVLTRTRKGRIPEENEELVWFTSPYKGTYRVTKVKTNYPSESDIESQQVFVYAKRIGD